MESSGESEIIDLGVIGRATAGSPADPVGPSDRDDPPGRDGGSGRDDPSGRDGGSGRDDALPGRGGPTVIESGPPGPPRAWGRPGVAGLVAVAVFVGAAVGYLAGTRHPADDGATRPPAGAAASAGTASLPGREPGSPTVIATGNVCAAQVGNRLQLGAEVLNASYSTVILRGVGTELPLPGLRPATAGWGACGELPDGVQRDTYPLAAGQQAWLTVTVDVLVPCPAPLPVGLVLRYTQADEGGEIRLPAFPDLGEVSYSGCSASPS